MEGVTRNENSNVSSEDDDRFPEGLRVLVVDDNVTYLHLLEKMLQDCSYRVTKCQRGEEALALIRENRGRFDIVLTDVHMPGMDGLQLLAEIANMDITLPVVMFSSDHEKDTVVKGVKGGARDFLVKPIRSDTLKILWRHVLRSNPSSRNNSTKELEMPHLLTTSSSNNTHSQAENEEENSKSLKRSSEDEADQGQTKSGAKKPRIVWTPELSQMFIMAVNSLGDDNAKPKKILQIMRKMTGLPHLTRQHVSSHLQKYRRNSNKIGEASEHQSAESSLINGPGFADLTCSPPPSSPLIGSSRMQNCVASAQYPSRVMSIARRQQCTSCSTRMHNLVEFLDNEALPPQPLVPLQQPNPLLENYGPQSAQCPSYAHAPSLGFTSPMKNNTHPVVHNQSDNSFIMQMFQTPSNMQIIDEAAATGHHLSTTTHPHPLQSQISEQDIQSLCSSTPHTASELGLPIAFGTIGPRENESCGSNIKEEFCSRNNYNPVAEDCQAYVNEAIFADMLDQVS
ncbi:two-component response regulator ARR1-like [Rhodamnia argentea]|uniref:Two-component response regulator ARR1-like n=1 Tax=Rhodamnia argentea TaxID=178133 RepID=A0ABM3H7F4_9MYRT|nr:two-component response regulator ARR1-like [Rhodamnia argentea]